MKKNMIKLAAGAAAILLMSTSAHAGYTMKKKVGDQDTKFTLFGFSQIVAGTGEGYIKDNSDEAVRFGADRIRLGWKYSSGNVRGKVFLDFNQPSDKQEDVGMYRVIKDAFISYIINYGIIIKAGVIKTPVGMGFTIPGWNLDVIKRGFDKKLAFERGNGLMISGRAIGGSGKVNGFEMGHERPWKGLGYDIMVANQTTRSGAVVESTDAGVDEDDRGNAYMGRLHFDYTELLHTEVSYGVSPEAGGTEGSEDYEVLNVGLDSHFLDGMNFKAEYYDVSGIKGAKHEMSTLAITYTAYLTDSLEFALKSINGTEDEAGTERDVGNHYVGFNYYPNLITTKKNRGSKRKNNQHTIKVNYVSATGDSETFKGAGGVYKDDVVLAMYQFKF